MEPDWAYLPSLALNLILDKLGERLDHVWFGAVCKNWCSVAKLNHQHHQFRGKVLPMLMIPTKRKSRIERNLYGIVSETVYNFKLPVPYSKKCCGSSHGWLATVDPDYVVTLMNPFKNLKIRLPRLNRGLSNKCYYERNMRKVTLSADPISNPNDYVVAAVHSERCCLAFIRRGQKFWTYIRNDFFCFTDITFYKGRVYAVGRWNNIVSFDLCYSDDPYGTEKIMPNVLYRGGRKEPYSDRAYLVKSLEGDLWMVKRFLGFYFTSEDSDVTSTGTKRFEVYKLELDFQSGKLLQALKLESLGDNILFVGDNDSISVSASYFSNCLRRDSIYYTDDYNEEEPSPYQSGPFDNGIYNVKDGSFAKHYPYNPSFKRMPPPFWILPPFQWDRVEIDQLM
ncbi:putative F-box protein At3g25750 [Gastrolobium bilobum]|uniref:putative F-box protein At3g25750 n=1 Tax=Gastrolobium bilobum TaxID=150636 RepID=UPI002AB098F8|nr:putative F-box protein At3g25750 [Gastrolobium bilobum]